MDRVRLGESTNSGMVLSSGYQSWAFFSQTLEDLIRNIGERAGLGKERRQGGLCTIYWLLVQVPLWCCHCGVIAASCMHAPLLRTLCIAAGHLVRVCRILVSWIHEQSRSQSSG